MTNPSLTARYRAACAALDLQVLRPGMRSPGGSIVVAVEGETLGVVAEGSDAVVWVYDDGLFLDFSDPATVGCLLAAYDEVQEKGYVPDSVYCEVPDGGLCPPEVAEAAIKALEAAIARYADVELAAEWDTQPMPFGRTRHMLSLASDDECVILCVENHHHRVDWLCSPPDFDGRNFADGSVLVEAGMTVDDAVAEAKRLAFASWDAWLRDRPLPGRQ